MEEKIHWLRKPETINEKGIYAYKPFAKGKWAIVSKHPIFSNQVYFKKTESTITFFIPTIDYAGKLLSPYKNDWGSFSIPAGRINLEPGYYPLDEEESNEDQAVFLLKLNEE